jgi:peptidoglycan/xylan/chitin deacetylase (PgdA/CDA1 family)
VRSKSRSEFLVSEFSMKHTRVGNYFVLLILISVNYNLNAQRLTVDNSNFFYQIAPIYDFKQGIVSLTFDDGYITQFTVALPLLKERNIPATFYIITAGVDSVIRSVISKNLSKDYEIGSHTVTHANLGKIGSEDAKLELMNSHLFLQKYFGLNSGLTMSYPWGIYNSSLERIAKSIYLAARSTDVGYNSLDTFDRYALKMQSFDRLTWSYRANSWVDFAIQNHLWLVEMIHGINNVGYSPIDSRVLTEHLDYIAKVNDKTWCSTVSNVIKYIDESQNAEIRCDFCTDSVYKLRINDFLDDTVFDQPLSIKIKVPNNWDSITITNDVKFNIEYNNKSKFIIFNALPDNKDITIRPRIISIPEKESGIRLVYQSANPFHEYIKISFEVLDQQDIDIILYDMNGKLLNHVKEKNAIGVINLEFDTSGISRGVYFLKVSSSSGEKIIKKVVKI